MKLLSYVAPALLLAWLPAGLAGVLPASGTPQTFTLADGAALPDSLSISAQVNGISTTTGYGISGGAVRLSSFTQPGGTTSTVSRLLLPVLDATNVVSAFTVNFDLALAAGTSAPASVGEGFSLNFGAIPGNNGVGETGFNGMAFGLTIGWDTRDNGGEERAINVYANGTLLGHFPAADFPGAFLIDDTSAAPAAFRPVVIRWDDAGLDITWNGVVICDNLQTPGFGTSANDRFAFSARTSDANQDVLIDNLLVNTTAQSPLATGGPVIWEFMARNQDAVEDDESDHPDWIEIFNGQPAAQNMTGWFLTNDPLNLQKWPFPASSIIANGFTYVFASGKNRTNAAHAHTNFTLTGEGGYIALVRPNGTIASSVTYGPQYDDVSAGFKAITDDVAFMSYPTPGRANTVVPNTSISVTRGVDVVTEEPAFTTAGGVPLESGFITANQTVVIQPPTTPGAQIRYTTNGATPTAASTLYSAPISVTSRSMAIRAKVFRTGYIPGPNKTLNLIYRAADLTNYRNTGRPFESNLPVLMLDSFGISVDSATDPNGARPHRYTYGMLFDPSQGTTAGKASLSDVPAAASGAGTHVRGQSSSGFAQRPYALEWWNSEDEDKDVAMLGMPADSDWVLYSPYNEETLMRNAVVYNTMYQWAGQGAGMRSRFVEVFFNQGPDTMAYADYRGVYLLVEKIKRGSGRVDVEKINAEVTDPAVITGGYVWKKDKPPQAQTISTTSTGTWGGQTWEVIEPNLFNTTQQTWLRNYVQAFDTTLMNSTTWRDPVTGYRQYADTASFADNLLWVEAFKQIDGYRISTYFHKTRNGKITARPAWDYNLAGGNGNYLGGENPTAWYYRHISGGNFPYWPRLLQDPDFVTEMWDRYWKARRSVLTTANVNSLIDSFSAQLRNADVRDVRNTSRTVSPPASGPDFDTPASRHFYKNQTLGLYNWPNCNNYDKRLTFQSEVEFFREWMRQRLEWMEFTSMDGSASLTKIRPPNIHDALTKAQVYQARVPEGYQITMADQEGLAGSQIYYTIDGPDPRTAFTSALNPAATALAGASTTVTTFIANAQPWKYFASLTAYPAAQSTITWPQVAYDDTAWSSGTAPIGYGESGLGTTITGQVPTGGNNQVTCFRKTFTVTDPAALYDFWVELNADDGAVVWINGQQAVRANMSYAPVVIDFAARATGVTDGVGDGEAENIFVPYRISPSLLVAGTNTIAVEVHQFQYGVNNPNTSAQNDMRFDLRLKGSTVTWPAPITLNGTGVHTVRARVRSGTSWSPLSEAEFTVGTEPASAANTVISEVMYKPSPPTAAETTATGVIDSNAFEYIELMNIGATPVDLTGLAIQDAIQMDFSSIPAASRILLPGARGLLVSNRAAFLHRHPGLEAQILGEWPSGNLRNGGEPLTLTTGAGASVIRSFSWLGVSPWPALAGADRVAGEPDYSMVLNRPETGPDHNVPLNWRSSGVPGGSPGAADATTPPADGVTDTDGDGLSDFSEWAFGANARPLALVTTWQPPVGQPGQHLMIRVPRNGLADGVNYTVQSSADLQAWTSAGFTDLGTSFTGSTEYRVFVSTAPVGAEPRFYLRAVATRP